MKTTFALVRRQNRFSAKFKVSKITQARVFAPGFIIASILLSLRLVVAQGVPTLTNVTDRGIAAGMDWVGGNGPFLLQKKVNLADLNWFNVQTTSNRTVIVPKDAQTGFFRLQDQPTNHVMAFTVLLNGDSEVPPVVTSGLGIGTLSLEGSNLNYYISFSGLSAPANGAHIHAPAAPTNSAGVLIPLTIPAATAGAISGTLLLTPDQVAYIVGGKAYINFHTGNNPDGEIRSQIVPLHIPIRLDGASEVPPVATSATGTGSLTLIGSQLLYEISYSALAGSGTIAHIHGPANATTSTGVLVGLSSPTGTSGVISGSISLTPPQLTYILAGLTYVNIHSSANQNGEIRGQIWPIQLGATLNGAAEVPPVNSTGTGSAFMTILDGVLTYSVTFSNLSSAASGGHIHGPADATHGAGVLIPFSVPAATSGTISGTAALNSLNLFYLVSGLTYVNIHTANNGDGEIRGQIIPAD